MKNLITLLLLAIPFLGNAQADCDKFCVRNIQINPENPEEVEIIIYSSENFINQTWIDRVEDEEGNLIAGYGKFFYFYGHDRFQNQNYPLPTNLTAIPSNLRGTVFFKFRELYKNPSRFEERTCQLPFPCPNEEVISKGMILFPNPTTGLFWIVFDNPYEELFTVEVYDLYGKKVKSGQSKRERITLEKETLSAGIYIVHLKKGDKKIPNFNSMKFGIFYLKRKN